MLISPPARLPDIARGITDQDEGSGEFGAFPLIPVLIGGAGFILGGGTLWHLHERHTEKSDYQRCLEKYTDPSGPHRMPPEEAARVCAGKVEAKGFRFGLNAPTFLIVAGSAFGLWFMTRLMIEAAKK